MLIGYQGDRSEASSDGFTLDTYSQEFLMILSPPPIILLLSKSTVYSSGCQTLPLTLTFPVLASFWPMAVIPPTDGLFLLAAAEKRLACDSAAWPHAYRGSLPSKLRSIATSFRNGIFAHGTVSSSSDALLCRSGGSFVGHTFTHSSRSGQFRIP
jgi:hypothetical protein